MMRIEMPVTLKSSVQAVSQYSRLNVGRPITLGLLCVATTLLLASCAHRNWNVPLTDASSADSYDFQTRLSSNADDVFVVLAFSGGGTRAAAFSYGVLEKLANTPVTVNGNRHRLLDEVDVITSVSGGSYTAAYYGLFGDDIFTEFSSRFLYQNWQGELIGLLANPLNLLSIASSDYNRSDLVAEHLDSNLFRHRSFSEMSRNNLPFVIINAADMNNLITFSYLQSQFDFLCSDLSPYLVADAVMASSALPGVFAPMALKNFPGCPERDKQWVNDSLENDNILARRYAVARALKRYSNPSRMPILRLIDGGVTDNLGVRGSMMSPVAQRGNVPDMAGAFTPEQLQKVRRVLVVVVNAEVYSEYDWSRKGAEPGLVDMWNSSFDAALGILNTETVMMAEKEFEMWAGQVNASRQPGEPQVSLNFSMITFNQIEDPQERDRFNQLPTTFHLVPQQIDELRSLAGRLLERSPEFQRFLHDVSD